MLQPDLFSSRSSDAFKYSGYLGILWRNMGTVFSGYKSVSEMSICLPQYDFQVFVGVPSTDSAQGSQNSSLPFS